MGRARELKFRKRLWQQKRETVKNPKIESFQSENADVSAKLF